MAKKSAQAGEQGAATDTPRSVKVPGLVDAIIVDRVMLAKVLGVHPDTVTDYTRKGMPVVTLGGHGKAAAYDLVACSEWQREQTGKNAKDIAQTRAFNATAELNELKLAEQRGDLIPRADVVRDGQSYTRAWSVMLRSLPRRARQAGHVVDAEGEAGLKQMVLQLLNEIAGWKTRGDADRAAKKAAA